MLLDDMGPEERESFKEEARVSESLVGEVKWLGDSLEELEGVSLVIVCSKFDVDERADNMLLLRFSPAVKGGRGPSMLEGRGWRSEDSRFRAPPSRSLPKGVEGRGVDDARR